MCKSSFWRVENVCLDSARTMNDLPRNVSEPRRLAILGSGTGTNAEAIVRYSQDHGNAGFTVVLVVSTKADAGIVSVAQRFNVPHVVLECKGKEFTDRLLRVVAESRVEMIALAGFLRVLDPSVIQSVGMAVLNVHPSLLPKYGGKGMYGIHVHEAVLAGGDEFTGATVHLVTDRYDEGEVVAQMAVPVKGADSAALLQDRVKKVEHDLFPRTISAFANSMRRNVV